VTSLPNFFPLKAKVFTEVEIPVEILQITHSGLLVDSLHTPLSVGKTCQIHFVFPIIDEAADVTVLILRTYAEMSAVGSTRKSRHMNELAYKKPPRTFNDLLIKFLATASHRQKT
jgi:hypothetical protein